MSPRNAADLNQRVLPQLRRAFWIGTIALIAIGLSFALLSWENRRNLSLVLQSQQIGRIARDARALTTDRETAIRGYLLSRDTVFLAPATAARAPLSAKLDSLVLLTASNVAQQDRAKAIKGAVTRWERGWAMLALQSNGARVAGEGADLAGKELFDSIRAAFDAFLHAQQRNFSRRVTILNGLERFTIITMIIEIMLLIGVLRWLSSRAMRQARRLLNQQEQLEVQSLEMQQQAAEMEQQAVELEEQAETATQTANDLLVANQNLEKTITDLTSAQASAQSATERLTDTESLLDFVLTHSPVGVALYDENRRIIRVNAALAAMSGVEVENHKGMKVEDLATDDITEIIDPLIERVLDTGESAVNVPVSGGNRVDPSRERHFLCSYFPITLPGRRKGVGGVVLDTTHYRHLEEQLLQAQKMEAVGRLAGGVAHDFNNMLTAILSYGELILADTDPSSSIHADLTEIVTAAEKASALTRQLLAFSRQQVLRPTVLDLNDVIGGLRKMLQRLTGNSVEISCRFGRDLWPVKADSTEIERVITNLVLNARDAMPTGGTLVIETSNLEIDEEYASTHSETHAGDYVMIAVTDSGDGMTREVREKLFEPFFTTKEKGKGTGLGLSSVYGIVKQSGGFIWVYSEIGKGTTFKIYLPRSEDATHNILHTPPKNRRVGSETILLVEDDANVRQVAMRILRQNGYRVLEATNGAEALRVCESESDSVDLIVTDIVMPEMGGAELAERVRQAQPAARILFTSGYTEDAAVRQSLLHPGEAFIDKPFTPATLAKKARELLDSANGESI